MPRAPDFIVRKDLPKYRSGLEIVADVLSIATAKARKTRIMYQANLSYQLIEKYLTSLLERGLLECDSNSCYLITSKGKEFLQIYRDYLERCKKIGEDINGARKERTALENICFNNRLNSKRIISRKEAAM